MLQSFDGVSDSVPTDLKSEIILGSPFVHEYIHGLRFRGESMNCLALTFIYRFRVSPRAFFQVNTHATDLLYAVIESLCQLGPSTTLLGLVRSCLSLSNGVSDICCGTGTIGLTLANKVKKVVGIEMVESAVEDAIVNANLNGTCRHLHTHCLVPEGVANSEYIVGKVEDVLENVLKSYQNDQLVGIVYVAF